MFELSFHLPGLVCRPYDTTDHRKFPGGQPLRQKTDISFLNWEADLPGEFLYETQLSCAIAGLHEHDWVTYGFVDTYFDVGDNSSRETLLEYHRNSLGEGGMNTDPLTYGNRDANEPIWDPRKYLLCVFLNRTIPMTRELDLVIGKLDKSFRTYEQVCFHYFPCA